MKRYLLLGGLCLVLTGFSGCGGGLFSNKEEISTIDTIGPMSSVETSSDDLEIDFDALEQQQASQDQEMIENEPLIEAPTESFLVQTAQPVSISPTESEESVVQPIVMILDDDQDGVEDTVDNCLGLSNSAQVDTDHDGLGNDCDATPYGEGSIDTDQDGITDLSDNCPTVYNPEQGSC
ncbi:MAG: thrombospondin type 3 repeat-containing protein [Candidatus Uhrbacteria bacterium]